jgi:uncharacterized membrane protein
MYRLWVWLRARRNRIWVTPTGAVLAAVGLALAAKWGNDVWPADAVPDISRDTLDGLLSVIAASMLSVATFSLGIIVSAFASASRGATPRASELVMGDDGARKAIAAFIAAFIYAIVAKTALGMGYYETVGRFVLFVSTLGVLAYLVARLLLWVRTLSTLGQLHDTLARIERVARKALMEHVQHPAMGAHAAPLAEPQGVPVRSRAVGYLTHINFAGLQHEAERVGATLHVKLRPGAFVDPASTLLVVEGAALDERLDEAVQKSFMVGPSRSYDQDPRFGLIVLSEVAQRALSPAVNDPGTAIHVLALMTRLLVEVSQAARATGDQAADAPAAVEHDRITAPLLDEADLVDDGFAPIARDGAATVEVGVRLQKMLAVIAQHGLPAVAEAARRQAAVALARSDLTDMLPHEHQRLAAVHQEQFG